MTRVKICGVTNVADRDAIVAAGADAFGVIVDVPIETPRAVDRETASDLVGTAHPFVTTVLVTMPNSVQEVTVLDRAIRPDAIQVHDGLSPTFVGGLGARTAATIIAAVNVDEPAIEAYADAADALLVDARDSTGAGGTGETVDWSRTATLVADLDVPVILAGGLTPESVGAAIDAVDPAGVDVASGVERAGGQKDHDAVVRFVASAHGTEAAV